MTSVCPTSFKAAWKTGSSKREQVEWCLSKKQTGEFRMSSREAAVDVSHGPSS